MNVMGYYKKLFAQENIDRTISGGIKPQIKLLLITIMTLLLLFSLVVMLFSVNLGESEGFWDRLWMVYNNFVDPGNQIVETSFINRVFVVFISFFGSVLLGGVLISTISNIIERRVDAIKTGKVTYKNISGHYVLLGFCDTTLSLIKEICAKDKDSTLVLMSGSPSEFIRSSIQSGLDKEDEERIFIYFGNIESEEELERLNIDRAKVVYIMGDEKTEGRDSKNLESVHRMSRLRGNPEGKKLLEVYVLFDSIPLYTSIQKMTLPEDYFCFEGVQNIYFRPFNYHENWARQLWGIHSVDNTRVKYKTLDYNRLTLSECDGKVVVDNHDMYVHVVIMGFNRMGQSLFLETLRLCHFANYNTSDSGDESLRTRITLIDKNMDAIIPYFKAQFPYLDKQIHDMDIEYINDDLCSTATRDFLVRLAEDKNCLTTVAVCISNPDLSLSLGLNLPSEIYENEVSVLIRQEIQTDLGRMIDSDEGRYKNVKIFGMLDQGMPMSLLADELPALVNQMYNCSCCKKPDGRNEQEIEEKRKSCELYGKHGCKFCEAYRKEDKKMLCLSKYIKGNPEFADVMIKFSLKSWLTLPEVFRWANRYQIDSYLIYCRALGYEVFRNDPGNEWELVDLEKMSEEIEKKYMDVLMRMEKYRWNAERTIDGWRSSDYKDSQYMKHHLILPYKEFAGKYPDEVYKDKDVVMNMPFIMELGGYKIYKRCKL